MESSPNAGNTKMGVAGGLVCVFLFSLQEGEVWRTIILAGIGAIVSFSVSVAMKWIFKRMWKK